jgi:hypothetical protein
MKEVKPETGMVKATGTIAFWAHSNDVYENDESHTKEIIAAAAQNGWIRIRHYVGSQDYWSIQGDRSSEQRLRRCGPLPPVSSKGSMHPGDQLKIHTYDDNCTCWYRFQDGSAAGSRVLVSQNLGASPGAVDDG